MKFGRKKSDKIEETLTLGEADSKKQPRKQRVGWVGPVVALTVAILIGLAIVIFGGKSEIELRLFGPITPMIVGACLSVSGTITYGIAYGIVGIVAGIVLWAVVFLM